MDSLGCTYSLVLETGRAKLVSWWSHARSRRYPFRQRSSAGQAFRALWSCISGELRSSEATTSLPSFYNSASLHPIQEATQHPP